MGGSRIAPAHFVFKGRGCVAVADLDPQKVTWAEIIAGVAVFLFTAIGAAMRYRRKGDQNTITRIDLLHALAEMANEARDDRHRLYERMERMGMDFKLDFEKYDNRLSEYAKSVESKFDDHDERLRKNETDVARVQGAQEARLERERERPGGARPRQG